MTGASIPAVILAAITIYVGLHNLFIYLRRPREREHLTFAVSCLAMGLYDAFAAGLYNAVSLEQGVYWQRLQMVALSLVSLAFPLFVLDYFAASHPVRRRTLLWLAPFSLYYFASALLSLFDRSGIVWRTDRPLIKTVPLLTGGSLTYYEAAPGIVASLQSLVGLGLLAFLLWYVGRIYLRGERAQVRPILLALALFFVGAVNDTAISSGLYRSVYLMEYAYMGIVLVMTTSLTNKIVRTAAVEEELRRSEERFRGLVETTSDWIWETDAQGRLTYTSPKVEDLLGYRGQEVIGRTMSELAFAESKGEEAGKAFLQPHPFEQVEHVARRKDGRPVVLETSGVPILDSSGRFSGHRGISRDISARKQAERELQERQAQLRALRQIGLELAGELDLGRLLESIAARAVELLRAWGGGLYLYRPDLDALEWAIGVGEGLPPVGTLLRRGEGLSGVVWAEGKPLAVDDYAHWERRARVHNGLPNVATASAPVRWRDEFLGVLNVVARPGRTFTPADVELVSLFASQAAVAIHNARMYEAAQGRAERLAVVNHVAHAVGTVLRLDELLEIVYRETMSIFPADSFFIALYDPEHEELDFRLLVDEGQRHPPERGPVGSGLTSLVVSRKEPLLIRNLAEEQDRLPTPLLWGTMRLPGSWLGVPMCIGERLVGVICVQSYTPNAYNEEDEQLLRTIADQVALAVERARLYEAISESEVKHRLLLQSIRSPVVALSRELTVLYCNEAYAELLGCTPEELEGRPLLEFAPSFAKTRSYAAYLRVLETGQPESVEGRMGNAILRAWVYPTPWGILAIAEDVTERRRLEELLRQTQKMEAIGTLAGGIAHDFNNLLTGILGYASVLQQEVPPDSVLYRDLGAIVDSATRASELTQQLLTVARSSLQREWKPLDVNRLVQEVVGLVQRAMDPSIVVRLHLAEALRAVEGDAGQLHQTLLNLCLNARDAMPNGGDLTIETANVELSEEEARSIPDLRAGPYVVVSVTDTGVGMDASVRERIFEPFFTTKEHGRGLGLAMAYGIVRAHGGTIHVYSELGHGSTFKVYLPAQQGTPATVPGRPRELPRGRETILVVDDEESVRAVLRRMLERAGYTVLEAPDGRAALQLYRERAGTIHLVILDLTMPGLGGRETLRRLKELDPNARVLVSSGYSENGRAGEVASLGACGFLQKPFHIATVLQKVREALGSPL